MSGKTKSCITSATVGIVTGGLTFWAVHSLTDSRHMRRKAAAKAVRMIGSLMNSL